MVYEWPGVRVLNLPKTERVKKLSALLSYLDGTQYAHKKHDFSGRDRKMRSNRYVVERLAAQGFDPVHKPPISERKPDAPVPLQRQVVQGFDQLIYPRGLAPTLEAPADPKTGRYLREVFRRSLTWATIMAARTKAGACGEAAMRVFVVAHLPKSEEIDPRELYVRRWADASEHIPAVAVWQRLVEIEEETDEGLACRRVWRTRVFDETQEYAYADVAEDYGTKADKTKTREDGETAETGWIPIARYTAEDEAAGQGTAGEPQIVKHRVGRCPVVWMQNTRSTTDTAGDPDCEGAYELADKVDLVTSMATRAAVSNMDPTLVVAEEMRWHNMNRVLAKGWGESIRLGANGKATLLETSGGTVEMGWKTYSELRQAFLQTCQAVIIDPETAGRLATSGKAFAMLWRPMEASAGKKRVPQEAVIEQVAAIWVTLGTALGVSSTEDEAFAGIVLPPVRLPKDVAERQGYAVVAEVDVPEGQPEQVLAVHQVGKGRYVDISWPPYHEATPEGFAAVATGLAAATGTKAVLSQRSGVQLALQSSGLAVDVDTEMHRIEEETEAAQARQAAFVDGTGGVDGDDEPDDGDEPTDEEPKDEDE